MSWTKPVLVFVCEVTDKTVASTRQEGVLVPHVVRCCVEEVERRGMDEVGIYRISGAANDIAELKTAFDSSKETSVPPLKDSKDCHRGLSTVTEFFIKVFS